MNEMNKHHSNHPSKLSVFNYHDNSTKDQTQKYKDNPLLNYQLLFPYKNFDIDHIKPSIDFLNKTIINSTNQLESTCIKLCEDDDFLLACSKINNNQTQKPSQKPPLNKKLILQIWKETVAQINFLHQKIDHVFNPIEHLNSVKSYSQLKEHYIYALEIVSQLKSLLYKSPSVYTLVNYLANTDLQDDHYPLDSFQKAAVKKCLMRLKLNGAFLPADQSSQVQSIYQQINHLYSEFANNLKGVCFDYSYEVTDINQLSGIPSCFLEQFSHNFSQKTKKPSSSEKGPWLIPLNIDIYFALIKLADNRELRKKIFTDFLTRNASSTYDNSKIISKIIILKQKLANLLGCDNYAQIPLENKMATNTDYIDEIQNYILEKCQKKYQKLLTQATALRNSTTKNLDDDASMELYDIYYWVNKLQKKIYQVDSKKFRDYFPVDAVIQGLICFVKKLYNLDIKPYAIDNKYLWDQEVLCYQVFDQNSQLLGYLFLDLFSRPGEKFEAIYMNGIRNHYVDENNHKHLAVTYIICNFVKPTSTSYLLTHWDISTLFHEMGHAIQHLVSTVDVYSLSGTGLIGRDSVEIASQLLEYWCFDIDTMVEISSHYQTGDKIDSKLLKPFIDSEWFVYPLELMRQLSQGIVDIKLHQLTSAKNLSPQALYQKVLNHTYNQTNKYQESDKLIESKSINSFFHIFGCGYSAGYYSYLWSKIIASIIFNQFDKIGLKNQKNIQKLGIDLKNNFLSPCASLDPHMWFCDNFGKELLEDKQKFTNFFLIHHRLID